MACCSLGAVLPRRLPPLPLLLLLPLLLASIWDHTVGGALALLAGRNSERAQTRVEKVVPLATLQK